MIAEVVAAQHRVTTAAFLSSLAHETRSALAAIQNAAEILLRYPPEDTAQRDEFVDMIGSEAERLSGLIEDLVEIERLETGTARLAVARVDLGHLADRARLRRLPLARQKDVELTIERVTEAPVTVDAERIERAIFALVDNAIKFSIAGGAVRIRVEASASEASVRVDDQGIGVAEAVKERIFERFYQGAVPPDSLSPRGAGLGLPLARAAAVCHRGRVTHAPRPDGSRFTLFLPRDRDGSQDHSR